MDEEFACNAGDTGDAGLIPGSERSPGGGNGKPTPVFLPGKFHGQRNPAGCSPWAAGLHTTERSTYYH